MTLLVGLETVLAATYAGQKIGFATCWQILAEELSEEAAGADERSRKNSVRPD